MQLPFLIISSLLCIAFGFWLTIQGKPYNQFVSSIHKISSILAGLFFFLIIWPLSKKGDIDMVGVGVIVVVAVMFIASVASGALLVGKKDGPLWTLAIHRTTPGIAIAASVIALVLLAWR
jgi:hypothetical protein